MNTASQKERSTWSTVGVILAAGTGARSGLEYPKQFLRLGGLTLLEHTLKVFEDTSSVDRIVVVGAADWLTDTERIVEAAKTTKIRAVIAGGRTRNESTRAAIDYVSKNLDMSDGKMLIHDAVRPLVDVAILDRVIDALDTYDAVDVVIESADTVVEVRDGLVVGIPDRSRLRRGQTPQGFALSRLRQAYETLESTGSPQFTDDCAVVMHAFPDLPVRAVSGSDRNVKVTTPVDVYLADRLLQLQQLALTSVNSGDLSMEGSVVVFGGTSGIGEAIAQALIGSGVDVVKLSRRSGVDVRSEDAVKAALAKCHADNGPIAAVVNTAGVLTKGPVMQLGRHELQEDIDVNLVGNLNVARAAFPYLEETQGHLLMFTSSSYTRGRADYAVYCATKSGVVSLTQALAEEWISCAIKVNCVNPARTDTPMRAKAFGSEPSGSLLTAAEVAQAAINVLATDVTGHVFDVRTRG